MMYAITQPGVGLMLWTTHRNFYLDASVSGIISRKIRTENACYFQIKYSIQNTLSLFLLVLLNTLPVCPPVPDSLVGMQNIAMIMCRVLMICL